MGLWYGNYGIFLIMGNAGFISSAVCILCLEERPGSVNGVEIP